MSLNERMAATAIARRDVVRALAAAPLLLCAGPGWASESFDPLPVVRDLARLTRTDYHDGAIATAIADRLLEGLDAGRFASSGPEELARRLNEEIAAISRDAHFVVMAGVMEDMRQVPPTEPHSETPPLSASELRYLQENNFGFAAAQLLPGNVCRIAIRPQFFRPAPEIRQRMATAMTFLSDSWGLVVDLSQTIGGDPRSVSLFLSYFFERPGFLVNRFRWRNLPAEEFHTTPDPGGPLYGEERPVAVLVSDSSFSAAEEFAYDMQVLGRGIIVGRKTPGAANHALPVRIAGGFTAFIPMARAENPLTGANWEGVGITPDIEADPSTPVAAHRAVLERIAASGDPQKAAVARRALAI